MAELVEKETTIHHPSYLARSESIAGIDRLLYELITGDPSRRPVRLWRTFGLLDSLRLNGWPYIDPHILNLPELSPAAQLWPLTLDEHIPYFMQLPAIRFHYGLSAFHSRRFLLSSFVTPYHEPSIYKGSLTSVQRIIDSLMLPEFQSFLRNGFTLLVQTQLRKDQASTSQKAILRKVSRYIENWHISHESLNFGYYLA